MQHKHSNYYTLWLDYVIADYIAGYTLVMEVLDCLFVTAVCVCGFKSSV